VLGYSPTQAGAAFLPMTVLIIVVAPQAGRLADRFGARAFVGGGLLLVSVSLAIFSQLTTDSTFWTLLPAMVIGGIGMAATMTPTTAAAMGAVQRDKAGVGSAVLNSSRQVGGSLGIAIMGAIVAAGITSSLETGHTSPEAFVHGLHNGLLVAAAFALVGSVIGFATVRKPVHHSVETDPVPSELVEY
jgi:MFS family permease